MRHQSLLALLLAALSVAAVSGDATLSTECTRSCGSYAVCVAFEGSEYCAPFCAPGRCNDTSETCIVQGQACSQPPCLPAVQCESKATQLTAPASFVDSELPSSGSGCARQCPMVNSPVCGSNRVSYANTCFFEQAQCLTPSITLASSGLCDEDVALHAAYNSGATTTSSDPVCDAIVCAPTLDPVCTSSGTMRNACYWKKAQCRSPNVTLLYRTACGASSVVPKCPGECTEEFVPVCGSNGVIYANDCFFRKANCERAAIDELRPVDLAHCELQIGDSEGYASDLAAILAATV